MAFKEQDGWREISSLPEQVVEAIFLPESFGDLTLGSTNTKNPQINPVPRLDIPEDIEGSHCSSLAEANDSGYSFTQIADIIEREF